MPTPTSEFPAPTETAGARVIVDWLATTPGDNPSEELDALRRHLGHLRDSPLSPTQLQKILDNLHERAQRAVGELIPRFFHVRLPIPPATRRSARTLQDVLELLARLYIDTAEAPEDRLIKGLRRPQDLTVWRAMHALAQHLFVSDLISAPATPGIWQQLHEAMIMARHLKLEEQMPSGVDCSIRALYLRALLLGCAQPSAFTAHEWSCIDTYVRRHGHLSRIVESPLAEGRQSGFWVKLTEDEGPVSSNRRPVANGAPAIFFACDDLLQLIDDHLQRLAQGAPPVALGLPEELPARLAGSLLRRLKGIWSESRKRRFPRRRQSYRAKLFFGFEEVWDLLRGNPPHEAEPSEWMVTNEGPDGYATMHVAGKPHKVQIGDLVALRSEDTADWQICIVRWALSENSEHLELGLQVLAPRAMPALLALPNQQQTVRHPALLLPPVPPLRTKQAMATVPGLLVEDSGKLVLLVESVKVEIREVKVASVQEQSENTDVFAIDPDRSI